MPSVVRALARRFSASSEEHFVILCALRVIPESEKCVCPLAGIFQRNDVSFSQLWLLDCRENGQATWSRVAGGCVLCLPASHALSLTGASALCQKPVGGPRQTDRTCPPAGVPVRPWLVTVLRAAGRCHASPLAGVPATPPARCSPVPCTLPRGIHTGSRVVGFT